MLANQRNGTIYIGVTSNLIGRYYEHRSGVHEGFTKKYKVDKLVYFEKYNDIRMAIYRETQLKRWKREWKITLIESKNITWKNLADEYWR